MIDLTLDPVYPIRVITETDSPVIIAKIQKYRIMKQKEKNPVLLWDEEDKTRGGGEAAETISVSGHNFWHAVYKGIEGSSPKPRSVHRDLSPQPPRDYVEDADILGTARH